MNRIWHSLTLCALGLEFTISTFGAEFKFPNHTMTVPDGFEVQLVAGPPLVDRPIMADFDEQGRLYVSDSSGSNDKVEKQLQEKPHRILRLEDSDGDGRFDQSVVFADKMMFPEGCLWFRGSLYVSAPPSIWKLTDTDGDGVADRREEWLEAKTLTGCANDLHGPYLGLDGWLYWCKGAFAKQTYERPGKTPFVTRAAHIFRARPDGSGIEPVLTGGMDNPVSVAFTAGGERLLTGTFFVHPGGGQRDGLIHAIYGGVYGKEHDVIDDHIRTGDLMPIMTHHGPSASCSIIRWESAAFGQEFQDNVFASLFNLHKITRHILEKDGATFRTRDEDFLVSDNPDFHPTHLLEDADGSLLVIDTGGWYKLCCPTSQLPKPDVLGAIYRVRRSGPKPMADPRGLKIDWKTADAAALVRLLQDERVAVRNRVIEELALKPGGAVPALKGFLQSNGSADSRRHAVWTLTRIEGPGAREAVRMALNDSDESVRLAAIHSASVWRDAGAAPALIRSLGNEGLHLKRAAAEALGRIGEISSVGPLLRLASTVDDRVLEHSLIFALIEIGNPSTIRDTLAELSGSARAKHAALVALDQINGGGVNPESITPLLASSDPLLKKTAAWIIRRHPEWAPELEAFFRQRLAIPNLASEEGQELSRQLSHFARDARIQRLLSDGLGDSRISANSKRTILQAMARSNLKQVPAEWTGALAQILRSEDQSLVTAAVAAARTMPVAKGASSELDTALRELGKRSNQSVEDRLNALAAVPGGLSRLEPQTFGFLRENLDASKPVLVRSTAASILAKAKLDEDQLISLTESIRTAGPLEVPTLLGAFEKSTSEALGLQLLAALRESKGFSGLRSDSLKPRLTNFPSVVQQKGEELLALLNMDAAQQNAHLEELLRSLKDGDIRSGQAIFNSQKAACASCHAIGYLGGNTGPDLTRIGQIRTERDLLEAIAYPSASFVRSYEPVVVSTRDGEEHSGVLRKDAPDELVLATGPGTEVRIARSDLVEMRPGTVSVMPGGLEEQLSRKELADLIAFLKATRW